MDDRAVVALQLGREPRAFRRAVARCPWGRPAVTEQAPYGPDGEPFPTTYYLTCRHLVAAVSRLEAVGGVERWTAVVADDPALGDELARATSEQVAIRRELAAGETGADAGASLSFGIGGSRNPAALKCLHAHVAYALARPGTGSARRSLRRSPSSGPRRAARPFLLASSIAPMSSVSSARREWEEGSRRFFEASRDPARADVLHRQLDAVTVELRRRVGGTFTLAELAEAYAGSERWVLQQSRSARRRRDGPVPRHSPPTRRFTHTAAARRTTSRERPRRAPGAPPRAAGATLAEDRAGRGARRPALRGRARARFGTRGPARARRHPDLSPDARAASAGGALAGQEAGDVPASELFRCLEQPGDDHADRRCEADPEPDAPVRPEEVVGHRDHADEDEDRPDRAQRDRHEALRDGGGRLDPHLAEHDDEHDRETDEEDELAKDAGVPPEGGDRHTFAFPGVPARERRHREHDPRDEREPVAEPEQPGVEAPFPQHQAGAYLGRRRRAGTSYAFPMSDEGRQPAGEGVAGATGARRRPVARRRRSSTVVSAPSRPATRARRARAAQPPGRRPLLGRAAPAPRGLHGACDDDVARDRAPVRAVGAPGSSAVRVASVALVVVIAVVVPPTLIANAMRVLATDTFVRYELGRDGFPPDRYGLTDEQRETLAILGLRSIEAGSEGIPLLERATLPDGSPAFDERELSHMADVRALFVPIQRGGLVVVLAIAVLAVALARTRLRTVVPRGLLAGALATLVVAVLLVPVILLGFDGFFTRFHEMFFEGNSWRFSSTDTLIRIYPERFWEDVSRLAATITVVQAIVLAPLAWWWLRSAKRSAA